MSLFPLHNFDWAERNAEKKQKLEGVEVGPVPRCAWRAGGQAGGRAGLAGAAVIGEESMRSS